MRELGGARRMRHPRQAEGKAGGIVCLAGCGALRDMSCLVGLEQMRELDTSQVQWHWCCPCSQGEAETGLGAAHATLALPPSSHQLSFPPQKEACFEITGVGAYHPMAIVLDEQQRRRNPEVVPLFRCTSARSEQIDCGVHDVTDSGLCIKEAPR